MINNIILAVASLYKTMVNNIVLNPRWWLATTIACGLSFIVLAVLQKKGIIKKEV